ncbi:MAG: adenylate cyclase [Parasphingorhabdus sp.]|jgi:adenylate cyclase
MSVPTTPARKLAVILHADIVGSTNLVQTNETVAHQRMQDMFVRFSATIKSYSGLTHELRGDALVAEFQRASDAVSASLLFQFENTAIIDQLDDAIRPAMRIGIAMGEVVIADNTITGEGVVLAQRLEQLAEPGGVMIQGAAYETIPRRLPFAFESQGEQRLKGFSHPVRAYAVSLDPDGVLPDPEVIVERNITTPVENDSRAIAVLPFTNMSGDPEQEYFSDGISDDIITALSHLRSFPVIARNSTFSYKGQSVNARQVADELGARYVLEGGVRKAGNRLRITTQLVDGESGLQVWASKFDRVIEDIFDIQDEITQKIVAMIQPELAEAELKRSSIKRPENLTAWDLVLRATACFNLYTLNSNRESQKIFQQAVDLDPTYSDAWAGLSLSFLSALMMQATDDRDELVAKGISAAKRAIQLDDRSSSAHYALGMGYVWQEKFQKAIREVEVSLQLNPYNAIAYMGLGNRLDLVGRTEEGIDYMEQSLKLSPREPRRMICMALLSRAYTSLGQLEVALEWIERGVDFSPDSADLHYRLAVCLANLDRVDEAERALAESERLQPGFLELRENWRPYSDDDRNRMFFSGFIRHRLGKKNH